MNFDEYKLNEKYVLFLDIKGFKKYIENLDQDKFNHLIGLFAKVRNFLGMLSGKPYQIKDQTVTANLKNLIESTFTFKEITFISDCIIVSHDDIEGIIALASNIQKAFLIHGFLMSGCIAKGSIYHNAKQNIMFGTAYQKAYEIGDKEHYPRIIIHDSIDISKIRNLSQQYLVKDEYDEKFFVDYLKSEEAIFDNKNIAKVQSFIQRNLEEHYDDKKILDKYNWLDKYFKIFLAKNI